MADIQPRTQDEENLRVLYCEVSRAFADRARAAAEELIIRCNQIVCPRRDDGHAEQANDLLEFVECVAEAYAASGEEDRTIRFRNPFQDIFDLRRNRGGVEL